MPPGPVTAVGDTGVGAAIAPGVPSSALGAGAVALPGGGGPWPGVCAVGGGPLGGLLSHSCGMAWCGAGRVLGPSWPTAAGRSCLLAALPRESLPVGVGLTLLELHGLGGARLGGEIVTP